MSQENLVWMLRFEMDDFLCENSLDEVTLIIHNLFSQRIENASYVP